MQRTRIRRALYPHCSVRAADAGRRAFVERIERIMIVRRLSIRLAIAMLTFLLGVAVTTLWLVNRSSEQEPRVTIPNDRWVQIFFEMPGLSSKSINEITSEARLPNLRTTLLPDDDMEVRFWVVADEYGRALILRRSANQWTATHLRGMGRNQQLQQYETGAAPKSGWEKVWEKMVGAGILTLPDATEVNCRVGGLDGVRYIVEFNMNRAYRTYMYDNPEYAMCDQAGQMIKVAEIIEEEFGWQIPEI